MLDCINDLKMLGSHNYDGAFKTAFDILDAGTPECNTAILLLSDFSENFVYKPLLDSIQSRNLNISARIFAFGINTDMGDSS